MSEHTKEPWSSEVYEHSQGDDVIIYSDKGLIVNFDGSSDKKKANARRIVSCVNACAGIDDPEAELTALRARVKELEEALGNIAKNEQDHCYSDIRDGSALIINVQYALRKSGDIARKALKGGE